MAADLKRLIGVGVFVVKMADEGLTRYFLAKENYNALTL